ncbi:hypothetical protein Anae109_4179 [Anaeromyxobacter sp. Fw109-5]|nr:hypothetical protein Anae109_4179 [Anaeromyxobacter sp. Fw109-5]
MATVDLILARIARDEAGGRMMLSLVASPAVAWLWAGTCAAARRFEAGQLTFTHRDHHPVTFLWHHLWIALYVWLGMPGLHALFGALLVAVTGVGAWSWARHRAVERRVGPEVLREWRFGLLRTSPELAARVAAAGEAGHPNRSSGGSGTLVTVLRVVIWLVPVASALATIALVSAALTR